MDCSLADQNSVNCLDESIRNLTILACGGSPLRKSNDNTSSLLLHATNVNRAVSLSSSSQSPSSSPSHIAAYNSISSSSPPPPPAQTPGSPAAYAAAAAVKLRKHSDRCLSTAAAAAAASDSKSSTYRISMANLEETQEAELDVILGELSLLEAQIINGDASFLPGANLKAANTSSPPTQRSHSRTNSTVSGATTLSISGLSEATTSSSSSSGVSSESCMISVSNGGSGINCGGNLNSNSTSGLIGGGGREPRTESPDNDSAFSDTVSLLSSESSASSSVSSAHNQHHKQQQQLQMQYMQQQLNSTTLSSSKAAKIQLALHKLENASIRRLFVKAFTSDGASKSLLVDERMTCGHVTRMLADKNHVQMQPNWALVENLGDLQMERVFEDHEILVDNLMTWNSDAGNRVLFQQRSDKVGLFVKPEVYLPGPQMAPGSLHDDNTRAILLEEFFQSNSQLQVDGPLYMKADSKKGWKRYHFVLRSSGLYYFPKEKTKNTPDLACLTLFNGYNVYRGLGWKKKWKAPTDYTFGFKSAVDSSLGKTCRTLKMLCAEDLETMEKWINAIRISKYGKQLWYNHKALMEDLNITDGISNSSFAVSMRSDSISSISSAVPSQCGSVSSAISSMSNSSGRISRASSSSSSGCLSDDNNGFDSEFTTGTIKRKPSMKPNLPLTTMTRQLKEVGEIIISEGCCNDGINGQDVAASPERSGTLTRRHSRRKSQESNGSGTLKRRQPGVLAAAIAKRGSAESMNASGNGNGGGAASASSGSTNSTPTPTPSICAKPLVEYEAVRNVPQPSSMPASSPSDAAAPNCMSSSTLSLDSLPPPPPPPPLGEENEIYGSQLSLVSLPPPPPPEDVIDYAAMRQMPNSQNPSNSAGYTKLNGSQIPPVVPAKPIRPTVKNANNPAPPYIAPPEYVGNQHIQQRLQHHHHLHQQQQQQQQQQYLPNQQQHPQQQQQNAALICRSPPPVAVQKKVSFADSPVLLRRKMCSPEPRSPSSPQFYTTTGPLPLPPRADLARLSSVSSNSSQDFGSPKRLQESASNPPRDFLKDLQRVMRKKWQVAQKCKLEPATTPHEVLGFRDFSDELHNLNSSNAGTHYYRETANVSNWVQEHYGAGAPPINEYALYENVHSAGGNSSSATDILIEPQYVVANTVNPQSSNAMICNAAQRKKRPPPPPPKRSDSTHLTHRV